MKNFPLLRLTTWILIPPLLMLSICCYSNEAVNLENADKSHHVVVVTNDGHLLRLLKWSVSEEGDLMGAGSRFSTGSTTVEELLDFSERGLGDPFNGTIALSEINSIHQEEFSWGTSAFTTLGVIALIVVATIAGAAILVWVYTMSQTH